MKFKTILLLIFTVLIAIISIQNSESTEVSALFWSFYTPKILIILGSFAIGLIVGLLISLLKQSKEEKISH